MNEQELIDELYERIWQLEKDQIDLENKVKFDKYVMTKVIDYLTTTHITLGEFEILEEFFI